MAAQTAMAGRLYPSLLKQPVLMVKNCEATLLNLGGDIALSAASGQDVFAGAPNEL